ncbi:hypothetical protein NFC81_01970 [Salinispirillum sp. LH 10-3-1]|uniref:Transglycosylase SLT domain-containing protein n=1 Tax=Salinispirillum sp. LH 10-3-1 TaxID=2952525 RepID=A0AB38YHI4_9GAMM
MRRHPLLAGFLAVLCLWALLSSNTAAQTNSAEPDAPAPAPLNDWQDVIRQSPYWVSQGMHSNLLTIRRWVLNGEAFCENPNRHVFFDRRAAFLGYIINSEDRVETQARLNDQRQQWASNARVDNWSAGEDGRAGYPFALNCNQPDARLQESLARYTGSDESARLWGTWDGLALGTEAEPISLHDAIRQTYEYWVERGRISMPPEVLSTLAGKTIIESGGLRESHSAAGARGIMQLSPAALSDCELAERFYFHRMAQIDCALRLLEQNHRNLYPTFDATFGHLPEDKADTLYSLLLIQAYHGGVRRIQRLMTDEALSGAAQYFVRHHERFTAEDIALGMVYHNLGRDQFGFASLYYVTDVSIAKEFACAAVTDLAGCPR